MEWEEVGWKLQAALPLVRQRDAERAERGEKITFGPKVVYSDGAIAAWAITQTPTEEDITQLSALLEEAECGGADPPDQAGLMKGGNAFAEWTKAPEDLLRMLADHISLKGKSVTLLVNGGRLSIIVDQT